MNVKALFRNYVRPVFKQDFRPRWDTKTMAVLALMTALSILLERFLGVSTPYFKLHLGYVPVAAAGMLYGLVPGMLVGMLADIVSNLGGSFSPVWVLFAIAEGGLYALFLHPTMPSRLGQSIAAQLSVTVLIHLLVNTLALKIMYNIDLSLLRLASSALTFPVRAFSLYLLLSYRKAFHKLAS